MRVLLAIDGSASSGSALELVGAITWPDATIIEVVTAVAPVIEPFGTTVVPMPPTSASPDRAVIATAEATLHDAAAALEAPGRIIRRALHLGRPATVIVDEAVASRAELVVIGSRGLGPLRSMLLGSVSAEVVDHAPCPVLVVRRPAIGTILLAVDGSPSAAGAVTFLAGSPFPAGHPIEVLSVAPSAAHLAPVSLAGGSDAAIEADATHVAAGRQWAEGFAAQAVEALRADGAHARWSISQGDPAHEIIEAAGRLGADLIVLGSRGLTGLARLVLGSVARNVLLHTGASVLIVHEPQRVRSEDPVRAEEPELAALATAAS